MEKIYSIDNKRILYIHNSAINNDNIIFGHGIDPKKKILKYEEPEEETNSEYQSHQDYTFDEGKSILMNYFYHTYKPTKEIIEKHTDFFSALKNVKEVVVLGHSLSNIDLPYFKEVAINVKPDARWTVSCFDKDDHERHQANLNSLKISNITFVQLEDMLQFNKQFKLELYDF